MPQRECDGVPDAILKPWGRHLPRCRLWTFPMRRGGAGAAQPKSSSSTATARSSHGRGSYLLRRMSRIASRRRTITAARAIWAKRHVVIDFTAANGQRITLWAAPSRTGVRQPSVPRSKRSASGVWRRRHQRRLMAPLATEQRPRHHFPADANDGGRIGDHRPACARRDGRCPNNRITGRCSGGERPAWLRITRRGTLAAAASCEARCESRAPVVLALDQELARDSAPGNG